MMRDFALLVIATIFLSMFFNYINTDENKLAKMASEQCGGAQNIQSLQFGGMWGGFGWSCYKSSGEIKK